MIFGILACLIAAVEIDLTGDWTLSGTDEKGQAVSCPMTVPGDTHDALFAAGLIPDPFWGCNETNVQWVGRHDWRVSRTFEVPSDFLARKEVVLRVEDCDTFCALSVNGREVGRTKNRFDRYTFDVKPHLKAGCNEIVGLFESAERIGNERREKLGRTYRMQNVTWAKNQALVRKPACHAGWDWGPAQMLMGFCGTVKMIASDRPRIDYVYTRQDFNADFSHCTLTVFADRSDGSTVTNIVEIDNPPLWWPNGAGEQKFYEYSIDEDGVVGRTVPRAPQTKRIGLRKIEFDRSGDRLAVKVNGRELFMKGANWIPCDAFTRRQTPSRYRDLLASAASANMNMIRLWGGGQFEQDAFYDLCDELGLLVWHDLMFACACYPTDEAFLQSVEGEISHQLRRLRDHASIALWCGDNECLGFVRLPKGCESERGLRFLKEWTVRNRRVAEQVAKADPTRLYWPSSPCNGVDDDGFGAADEMRGDEHCWGVWFEQEPFESYYAHRPRFCSEFGVQSFPSPETARTFASHSAIAGREPDFEWHQKNKGGNRIIRETLSRRFKAPKDTDAELLLSQFQQGQAIKMAAEGWRAQRPHCMGTLYWQLNDNWPVSSWSSIEYGGKWKPLQYLARRFYAPVAVVACPDVVNGTADVTKGKVFALNDTAETVKGELTVEYWTYDGQVVQAETKPVTLPPDSSTEVGAFDAAIPKFKQSNNSNNQTIFLVLALKTAECACRNDWHFGPCKDRPIACARINHTIRRSGNRTLSVELSTDQPAFYVWADVRGVKGTFDDNSLTLLPGRPRTLTFRPDDPALTPERFREALVVTHLGALAADAASVASDIAYLAEVSRTNVLAARFPMDDGTMACPPQAKRGYQQFFLRDYAYVLEGCADVLPEKDLLDAARLFLKAISPDGAGCDFVDKSGWYNYRPGGGSIGKNPVIDGTPFTVAVEYLTWKQTHAAELLAPDVLDKLARAMEKGVPRNPKTGLVHITPLEGEVTLATKLDRAPYGFTDVVRKQGDVLFGSLLYVEAARRLAEMFGAAGRLSEAGKWRTAAEVVADGVNRTLWDEKTGLYLAASHTCRQADVWGSAFAVWLGVAGGTRARRVSQTLVRHYDGIVQNGQVRHLLPGEYWQLVDAPHDTYQNGGYWGTASGWVANALAVTDLPLARRMLADLVRFYREKGVPEWSIGGVGKGHLELEGYLASTTVPLAVFRRMNWMIAVNDE